MEFIPAELFPLEPEIEAGPPELEQEDLLLQKMALEPIDASASRAYARRRYPMYLLLAVAFIGLPCAMIGATSLIEWGFPRWLSRVGIVLVLCGFFVFFFAMLISLTSRSKVFKHLGLAPVERPNSGIADDVSILAQRHGRTLEYGIDGTRNFWRYGKAVPNFQAENRNGQFFVSAGLPPAIHRFLSRLPRNKKLWRHFRIQGGPWGIQTSRPVRQANAFIHDLWLLEGLLDAIEK